MSRAAQLDCQHERSCALVLTLFLFQKGQGFFPPLPIAALLPRSRRGAYLPLAGWDASVQLGDFAAWMNGLLFFSPQWTVGKRPLRGRMLRCGWSIFATQKASVKSKSRWPLLFNRQGAALDPRAAKPVAERR